MIAKDILKSARYMLSDTSSTRWTDERLISLLNDGLADIAKTTILFIDTLFVALVNDLVEYDLSAEAVKIVRIEFEDKELKLTTHTELDKKKPNWALDTGGKPLFYMLDKQREACFKLYPKVQNAYQSNVDFSGPYGIITAITYSELQLDVEGLYGDLGELQESGYLKVYYVRKHPSVTDILDEIYISDIAKEPLAHYIAGRALLDNQDTQNRTLGNEELGRYKAQLDDYSLEKSKNFSQAAFTVPYNPSGV